MNLLHYGIHTLLLSSACSPGDVGKRELSFKGKYSLTNFLIVPAYLTSVVIGLIEGGTTNCCCLV